MGQLNNPPPVLLVLAMFSGHDEALDWARAAAEKLWGPVFLASEPYIFDQTKYYEKEMGQNLKKRLLAFRDLVDPGVLSAIKLKSNELEDVYARHNKWPEARPLNLDPGYLTEKKFVLASTKDRDHRIYVGSGIFAESTLFYKNGSWQAQAWTYSDYHKPEIHDFLLRCRKFWLEQKKNTGS